MARHSAVVYRRVSSAQQGRGTDRNDGGWSLQSQEAKATEWATNHGLTIKRVFEEVASASKLGRPVFAELIEYLNSHPGTVLVVEKIDRLARNSRDLATVASLIDAGVEIHCVRDAKVLNNRSSPGDRLSSDIEGAVAIHTSRNLGLEVKKGIDARFEAGYFPMGDPPFGYTYPPRRAGERVNIVPDPEAAQIVVKLFETYVAGEGVSFREIVRLAHQLGYQHPRGGRMSLATARKLLMNPTYAGWIRHNGEIRRGFHEPIVTQSLFDKVQARMAGRPRSGRPNMPSDKMTRAFSGIFVCAHCGGAIGHYVRVRRKRTVSWYCRSWCKQAKYFPDKDLFAHVCEHLEELQLPKERVGKIVAELKRQVGRRTSKPEAEAHAIISREQKRRKELFSFFQDGDITKEQYKERKLKSEQKEVAAREHLSRHQGRERLTAVDNVSKSIDRCREWVELFASGSPKQQRKILGILWETSSGAGKSKLDALNRRIEPSWRPMWRALLDAREDMDPSKARALLAAAGTIDAGLLNSSDG